MSKTSVTKSTKKDQPYTSKLQGVAALLGENAYSQESETTQNTPTSIAIAKIQLPPSQPRRYFDPDKIEELSRSIKELGILEPLLVRPVTGGNYELVAGERRYKAAQLAGLTEVPVVIREMDDVVTSKVQLVENLQREDLNPIEETEGILDLVALQLAWQRDEVTSHLNKMRNVCDRYDENSLVRHNVMSQSETKTIEELFASLARMSWESFVKNRLPLLKLPEVLLNALREGKIEYTKARAIAKVKNFIDITLLLDEAIRENLSLAQISERVKEYNAIPKESPSLKVRYQQISGKLQKAKVWDNPKKHKALEKLVSQIEQLLDDETSTK
jgi:ParB family transcriptional regulator, chromosome partitioning protein